MGRAVTSGSALACMIQALIGKLIQIGNEKMHVFESIIREEKPREENKVCKR